MLVAPQHVNVTVTCPNCNHPIDPWKAGLTPPPQTPPTPPPPALHRPFPASATAPGYSWRNRWIAGALGILLGPFGVHRFYLGYTGIGIVQVALTVGSLFILTPVVAIWAFIEGILCFCGAMTDADGLPLQG
jgi:TM2 domain-containing membrane protein YozV